MTALYWSWGFDSVLTVEWLSFSLKADSHCTHRATHYDWKSYIKQWRNIKVEMIATFYIRWMAPLVYRPFWSLACAVWIGLKTTWNVCPLTTASRNNSDNHKGVRSEFRILSYAVWNNTEVFTPKRSWWFACLYYPDDFRSVCVNAVGMLTVPPGQIEMWWFPWHFFQLYFERQFLVE